MPAARDRHRPVCDRREVLEAGARPRVCRACCWTAPAVQLRAPYRQPTAAIAGGRAGAHILRRPHDHRRLSSTDPTCRTSPSAPRKAARSARPSSPSRAPLDPPTTARRAAAAGPHRRHRPSSAPSRGQDIHAMTASRVRGASRGCRPTCAAGQGDQLRHRLRHLGVRAGQPAVRSPTTGGRLYQELLRAFPGIRAYMDAKRAEVREQVLHHPVRRKVTSRYPGQERRQRRSQRARKRADPGTAAASSAGPWCACRGAEGGRAIGPEAFAGHDELVFEARRRRPRRPAAWPQGDGGRGRTGRALTCRWSWNARAAANWDEAH